MTAWLDTRLKYLASAPVENGVGEPGSFDDPSWPRYVRTTDLAGPRTLRTDTFASLPPRIASVAMLRRADLLLVGVGATIGKSYLHCDDAAACYAGFLVRFRARSDVDPRFVAYWTESAPYRAQIESLRVKSTVENFSAGRYRNLRIRLPDFKTQKTIADHLDCEVSRIDEILRAKRRLRELLEAERAGIIEAGVGGHLGERVRVESGISWLPTIPVGWDCARLKYIARVGSGHTPSRQHPEWWIDCSIPWVTTGDVHRFRDDRLEILEDAENKISLLGLASSSAALHPKGTVVLSRTASVGFSAIMGTAMATSQDFATWTCSDRILPEFLLYCLRAMRRDLLGRLAQGSTHQTIYMPDIDRIMVPLPRVEEQRAIVGEIRRRVARIDRLTAALDTQFPKLEEYRHAFITAAVGGDMLERIAA